MLHANPHISTLAVAIQTKSTHFTILYQQEVIQCVQQSILQWEYSVHQQHSKGWMVFSLHTDWFEYTSFHVFSSVSTLLISELENGMAS